MLYVGFLESPFRWVRHAMLAVMGLIFLGVMAVSAWFSVRWARSIFRPVEQMNRTMQRVEDGEAAARVGQLPARDELGALAGHLDQLLDVIDDKTTALRRWGEELDHKVAERTRELEASNASLQLAQQQLVKSEKLAAIGQLTASIAHEINNPIAVMQGNLDLIRDTLGEHAQPVKAELKLLDEQVERMRLIVTQLLQYARPTEYAGYVETLDFNQHRARLPGAGGAPAGADPHRGGARPAGDAARGLQPSGAAAGDHQPAHQRHPGHAAGRHAAPGHA
jgi:two-component system, NtrC family, sensor kinase